MTKKSRGPKSKTRNKLRQKVAYRPSITKFLQEFYIGQDVVVLQEPSSHKGMPFQRFKGMTGKVVGKRGAAYLIDVMDGNMKKTLISRPEHLKAL